MSRGTAWGASRQVKILNKSKNTILAGKAELAENIGARMKGLLGRRSLGQGEALVIRPCASIHTFGMRFTIDAVFFDKDNKAIAALHDLKPFRISGLYPKAKGVVEVPAGTLLGSQLAVGDELEFIIT